jgi:hypothetical protein
MDSCSTDECQKAAATAYLYPAVPYLFPAAMGSRMHSSTMAQQQTAQQDMRLFLNDCHLQPLVHIKAEVFSNILGSKHRNKNIKIEKYSTRINTYSRF